MNLDKRNPLSKAIKLALLAAASTATLTAPSIYAAEDEADVDEKKIVVTGSRLSKTDIEGPAPITVITAEDIEANGFTTAFEALKSLPQVNGSNQGAQDSGTFTQGADSVNLRAIGSGRSLTLVNGRRVADYPLPFNGQSNIVNVANIPAVMIDRIEILSAGASAIYGSDAIGGVFNIILKDNIEGMHATARFGDTHDGGGESYRLQFSGGKQTENLNLAYGFEIFNREPIMAYEREFMDSFADNPDVISGAATLVNSRSFLILDPFDGNDDGFSYVDPGAATCDPLSNLAQGTVEYSFRPNAGNYCGTASDIGFSSIRNAKDNITGFMNLSYELNNGHEFYATAVVTDGETRYDSGTTFWQATAGSPNPNNPNALGSNYFVNEANTDWFGVGGQIELWQRIFTPEEVADNANTMAETVVDFSVGLRGEFMGGFDYEATVSLSQYDLKRTRRLINGAAANQFFLGDQTGTVDFGFGDFAIFNAPSSNLYRQLTHEEYLSISGIDTTNADSKSMTSTFAITNNELFEMSGGYAGLALVLEAGSQEYSIDLDSRLTDGTWFGFTGTGGGGERDRYALGAELRMPITDQFTTTLAARWDKYDDATNVDDAITYNLGLEYRPIDDLLLRGNFATSFRAPDMHYVYADPSGFFTSTTDQYLCRDQGQVTTSPSGAPDYSGCTLNTSGGGTGTPGTYGIGGAREGSTFLEEEEGESYGIGFVYDITEDLSVSVDYYSIVLENVVRDQSIGSLLELEANCRLGANFAGTETFDVNSAQCQNAISLVSRNGVIPGPTSELIQTVTTGPINAAFRETTGFDTSINYKLATDEMGDFRFVINHNAVNSNESKQFADDAVVNRRSSMFYFDYRSTATASINWRISDWSTTLFARRTGSLPNWAETERCCERTTYNISTAYQVTDDLRLGLFINNVQNKNPQVDPTFNSYPYYFTGQVDAYGREYSLQFDYSFGE